MTDDSPTDSTADDAPTADRKATAADAATTDEASTPPVGALAEHAVPLDATDPDAPLADLEALHDRLADARVVGLGEATHGTREFFQLKHRLVRYLVEELDCRAFALEANFSETLAVDDYVVHGRGDPREALDGVYFWTWNVESVLALVEWLRAFNADRPLDDRVRFYGVDAQYTEGPARALREFFAAADPGFLDEIRAGLDAAADGGIPPQQADDHGETVAAVDAVLPRIREQLVDHRDEYVEATSAEHVALARRHATVLEQAAEYKRTYPGEDHDRDALQAWLGVRDRAMADNVDWVLDRPGVDRVAAWGHDAHVNRTGQPSDPPARSLGSHLADRHGDDYWALGFAFARGAFQALDTDGEGSSLGELALDGPLPDTFEAALAEPDHPLAVLDIRAARDDDRLADWLASPRAHFSVGATFDPTSPDEYLVEYRYADAFDAVCYVAETTRARPLPAD